MQAFAVWQLQSNPSTVLVVALGRDHPLTCR